MKQFVLVGAVLILTAGFAVTAQEQGGHIAPTFTVPSSEDTQPVMTSPAESVPSEKIGDSQHLLVKKFSNRVRFDLYSAKAVVSKPPFPLVSPMTRRMPARSAERPQDAPNEEPDPGTKFNWSGAIKQSLLFLSVQHGFALSTQSKTRSSLRGPFFKDYIRSVKSLSGWSDGGRFFTNYIAHPMQGSFLGFIQVQNDPKGKSLPLSKSRAYWKSRAKAFAWSAAWSTQFEIGPISQASIGNIGSEGKQTYVDIVITPTAGLLLLIVEDALDKYLIRKIERRTRNNFLRIFSRIIFNPTRSAANIVRLKTPWHRDSGLR